LNQSKKGEKSADSRSAEIIADRVVKKLQKNGDYSVKKCCQYGVLGR
jgi:hypothetical protein